MGAEEKMALSVEATEHQLSARQRLREMVVCGTFRAVSMSLKSAPKALPWAVSRLTGSADAGQMDSQPKLLPAGQNAAIGESAALEEDILSQALPVGNDHLGKHALKLVHAFREELGEWMHHQGGVVMQAEIDDPYAA